MFAGMVAFIPITVIAKYAMALLIIAVTVRLSEWVDKRCYTVVAAVAASGGTFALSVFGGIFDFGICFFLLDREHHIHSGILKGIL